MIFLTLRLAFGEPTCPSVSQTLETIPIQSSCFGRGDPEEDVHQQIESSRWYNPRPPLPRDWYSHVLQVKPNSLKLARIRTRLVFTANDPRNVIATVPECTRLLGAGPMKNSSGSHGIGNSVLLTDPSGEQCQGFISTTVVRVLP